MPINKIDSKSKPTPEITKLMPDFAESKSYFTMENLRKYLPWIILVVVVLIATVLVFTQFSKAKKLSQQVVELKQSPEQVVQEQSKKLIEKVGKLIILPVDEEPTIATVTDLKPLQDQPFFKNAKLGDKVIIYSLAKKAVLYREEANIVVEVAPLNIGDDNSAGTTKDTETNSNVNRDSSTTESTNKNSNLSSNSNSDPTE